MNFVCGFHGNTGAAEEWRSSCAVNSGLSICLFADDAVLFASMNHDLGSEIVWLLIIQSLVKI